MVKYSRIIKKIKLAKQRSVWLFRKKEGIFRKKISKKVKDCFFNFILFPLFISMLFLLAKSFFGKFYSYD